MSENPSRGRGVPEGDEWLKDSLEGGFAVSRKETGRLVLRKEVLTLRYHSSGLYSLYRSVCPLIVVNRMLFVASIFSERARGVCRNLT